MKSYIIEKIKKLLSLSNSSNKNEASVALNQVIKLMEEFKITQSDLDKGYIIDSGYIESPKPLKKWELMVLNYITLNNGCISIIKGIRTSPINFYRIIGREVNVNTSLLMFDYDFIKKRIKELRIKRIKEENSYVLGFISSLEAKNKNSWGIEEKNKLILTKQKEIDECNEFIKNENIKEAKNINFQTNSNQLVQIGRQDGKNFNLNRQVQTYTKFLN